MKNLSLILTGFLIAFLWGLNPVLKKQLLSDLSPQTVMLILNAIFMTCLLIYSFMWRDTIKNDMTKITSQHMHLFIFIAVVTSFVSAVFYYQILNANDSSKVILLTSMWPIFGMVLAQLLLKENVKAEMYFAAAILSIVVWKVSS